MNYYLIFAIGLLILYLIFKPNLSYNPFQEEIQSEEYVDKTKAIKDFPYPQISRTFKRLSHGKPILPIDQDKSLPKGEKNLTINRTTDINNVKQRMYLPDYYRKDRLSGNTIGSEELRPFLTDENKSESSWTDKNVSEHPKFYNSEVTDNLTNIGSFFDKNNNYNDKTSPSSVSLVSDKCYMDKMGNQFCEENTRLQNIPPRLISDPESKVLNTIGFYKDNNIISDMKDKIINGGIFYDNIKGSKEKNETYSSFNNNPQVIDINF